MRRGKLWTEKNACDTWYDETIEMNFFVGVKTFGYVV